MDKTVKQILEDALKRVYEDHSILITTAHIKWAIQINGDTRPIQIEFDGEAR